MITQRTKQSFVSENELNIQREYCKKVKIILDRRYGKSPLACVATFGCQQNVADSERLKGMLSLMGYSFTEDRTKAKLIIFNTCAVREHAEDRVFGNVGQLKKYKKENPDVIIAVCGCMMQEPKSAEKIRTSFPFVSLVFGTHVEHKLPQLLYRVLNGEKHVFDTSDSGNKIAEGVPVLRDSTKKAFVPIMHGCNNFCTYCIVPYVRGREQSRDVNSILKEVKALVDSGCKEITLLGQNVNSYGKTLEPRVSFAELLKMINNLDGDFRIRFMTSHPKDCSRELIDTVAECDKVAKHIHLPFQSGNDSVLKSMNRGYTRRQYLDLVNYAREKIGESLSLTSDIIVGFPGETYEQFLDTVSLVKQVKFSSLFTFIYSPRSGTPAAKMDDPVSGKQKGEWLRELLAVQEEISAENMKHCKGKIYKCFVTGKGKLGPGYLASRTDANLIAEFKGDPSLIGTFQNVKITNPKTYILQGELI